MGIINFIKSLFGIETDADIIGLSKFNEEKFDDDDFVVQKNQNNNLTPLLNKANL